MHGRFLASAHAYVCTAALAVVLASCAAEPTTSGATRTVGTFTARIDPVAGTLTVIPDDPAGLLAAALTEVPVASDGVPGTNPPNTLELVTEAVRGKDLGCGGTPSFEGVIRMRSFFAGAQLRNVHVQFVELSNTGREACNSDPEIPGTNAALALFDYGDLAPAGRSGNHAARVWKLRLPDQTSFTFRGVVLADVVTDWPPKVVSTSPAAGAEDVAPGAAIEVTFDEPIDPATLAFQVSGGVTGTASWDAATRTSRFVPSAPLQPATTYTVTIPATVADPGGNALGAAHVFSFATATPWQQISGTTYATIQNKKLLFAENGDGLALWTTFSGTGNKLFFRTYSPADRAWGPAVQLAAVTGSYPVLEPAAAAGTNGFLVVWSDSSLKGAEVKDGKLGATTVLSANGTASINAASNGRGFAVVYQGKEGTTSGYYARTFDGAAWSAPAALYAPASGTRPAIASNGVGYLAVLPSNPILSVQAWLPGTGWRSVGSVTTGNSRDPAVASNGSTYCILYTRDNPQYRAEAIITNGSTLPAATMSTYATNPTLSVASNGSGYLAVVQVSGVSAWVYDGAAWSASRQLSPYSTTSLSAVASGTAYAVAWTEQTLNGLPNRLAVRTFDGTWSAADTTLADATAYPQGALIAGQGSGWVISSSHDDGARHQLRALPFGSGGAGTPSWLGAEDLGSGREVVLATNASGDAIAAWSQVHRGRNAVFAAVRTGGTWGAPELVSLDAQTPIVAAADSAFLVAYTDYANGPARTAARVRSSGTFGAPYILTTGQFVTRLTATSDGQGFGVAYLQSISSTWQAYYAIWSGGAWSSGYIGTTNSSGDLPLEIVGSNGEYRLVWKYYTGATGSPQYHYQLKTRRLVNSSGSWSFPEAELLLEPDSATNYQEDVAVARGPAGDMILWGKSFPTTHLQYALCSGATCAASAQLASTGYNGATITSGFGGFVAVYNCASGWCSNLWTPAGGWSGELTTGATSALTPSLASSGTAIRFASYNTALLPPDYKTTDHTIKAAEWSGAGSWSAPFLVETASLTITQPIGHAYAQGSWIVTFQQSRPLDPAVDAIYARTDL